MKLKIILAEKIKKVAKNEIGSENMSYVPALKEQGINIFKR